MQQSCHQPPLGTEQRIGTSLRFMCASLSIRSLSHRSQVIRMNHDGNARNGSSRASSPVGSGSWP